MRMLHTFLLGFAILSLPLATAQQPKGKDKVGAAKTLKVSEEYIKAEKELAAQLRKTAIESNSLQLFPMNARITGNLSTTIAFSPLQNVIAYGGSRRILIQDIKTQKVLLELPGFNAPMKGQTIAFSPDAKMLAVQDAHQTYVYDTENGKVLKTFPHEHIGWHVCWSADGSTLTLITGEAFGAAPVFLNTFHGRTFAKRDRTTIHNGRHTRFWNISPSGNYLLHVGQKPGDPEWKSDSIVLINLVTGAERSFRVKGEPQTVVMSWDDKTAYFTAWPDRKNLRDILYKLDIVTGEITEIARYKGFEHTVLAMTTDNKHIFMRRTPGGNFGSCLIEAASGKMKWYTNWYIDPAVSPGGEFIGGVIVPTAGLNLFTREDLLSDKWADSEDVIDKALEKKIVLEMYRDAVTITALPDAKLLADIVKWFPSVSKISLTYTQNVNAETLEPLTQLQGLKELSVPGVMGIDDKVMGQIAKIGSLERLQLQSPGTYTDAGLASLKSLTKLEELNLSFSRKLNDSSLKAIAEIKSLRVLTLPENSEFTGDGFAALSSLNLRELTTPYGKRDETGVKHLGHMSNLESLKVRAGKLSTDDCKALAKLTNLQKLYLESNCDVTDEGLESLKGLTKLRELWLTGFGKPVGAGFVHLAELKQLERLSLLMSSYTDEHVMHLKGLTSLKHITLSSNKMTDEGLAALAGMKQLESVSLPTTIKGTGFQHLKDIPTLLELDLKNYRLTDAGMEGLKGWKHLQKLTLPNTITDAGIAKLEDLPALESLTITENKKFKGASFASLNKAAPNLRTIVVSKTGVGNDALPELLKFQALRELYIRETAIDAKGLPDLSRFTHLRVMSPPQLADKDLSELRKAIPKVWVLN